MAGRSTAKLGAASPLAAASPIAPLAALVALALALALAGCGGTSHATPTTGAAGPAGSAAEQRFIAHATLICALASQRERPLKARKEALRSSTSTATAGPAFASLAREAAAIARTADERLAALPRPAADARAIGQLVHAYSLEATDAGEIANGVANKDSELGEAASDALAGIVRKNLNAAKRLGMGACFTLE